MYLNGSKYVKKKASDNSNVQFPLNPAEKKKSYDNTLNSAYPESEIRRTPNIGSHMTLTRTLS